MATPTSNAFISIPAHSSSILRPSSPLIVPSCPSQPLPRLVSDKLRIPQFTHHEFPASTSSPSHVFATHDSRKRRSSSQPRERLHLPQQRVAARDGPQRSGKVERQPLVEELAEITSQVTAAGVMLPAHVDHLSSVGNPFVKHVVKLRQSSSYRHACCSVVVVGDIPLRELCEVALASVERQPFIDYLLLAEGSKFPAVIETFSKRVVRVTSAVMHKLSGLDSIEGIEAVGVVPLPESFLSLQGERDSLEALSNWCPCPERLLVLDAIQDPGNLGTLLRTAAAFDWDGVFLADGCCDPFNEKALRASRGACFRIPIASGKWSQLCTFADLKEIKLYAGEPQHYTSVIPQEGPKQAVFEVHSHSKQGIFWGRNGEQKQGSSPSSVNHLQDLESLCLILGSEGQGLSEEARAVCNLISIPMHGRFESLNVAVAGGILLFVLQKIRNKTLQGN